LRKLLRRLAVVGATTATLGAVAASPAMAATGGGCNQRTDTTPCISWSNNFVYGDFYQYAAPDSSRVKYRIEIWTGRPNKPWVKKNTRTGAIDHTGHYAAVSQGVASLPAADEHAMTRVIIFSSSGATALQVDSPVVYYLT
jgi:hypothetical protein